MRLTTALYFFFFVLVCTQADAATSVIKLTNISFLEENAPLKANDIPSLENFVPADKVIYSQKIVWLKLPLHDIEISGDGDHILFSGSTEMIRSMEGYFWNGSQLLSLGRCHYNLEDESCMISNLQYAFPAPISNFKSADESVIYLRVDPNGTPIWLNFYLMSRSYYNKTNTFLSYLTGFTTGTALIIFFATLVFYVANRKLEILIFSLFALTRFMGTFLFRGTWDAYASEDLLPAARLWPFIHLLSSVFEIYFIMLTFKNLQIRQSIKAFTNIIMLSLLFIGVFAFTDPGLAFFWNYFNIGTILIQTLILLFLIYLIYKHIAQSLLFTLCWLPGIGGFLIWSLYQLGFLGNHWALSYSPIILRPVQLFLLCFFMYIKIQEVKNELAIAREREQQANITKTLLRTLSHDLSNTSAIIQLQSELGLHTNLANPKQSFQAIHEAILMQNSIIAHAKKNYLNRSGGIIRLESVSVKTSIEKAVGLLGQRLKNKNILLEVTFKGTDFNVLAEEVSLTHQVFVNLIDNAIKFTPKGKQILTEVMAEDPAFVQVIVRDEGIGIPEDIRIRLFDDAPSVHRSGTDNEEGSGIGLLVVRDFVNAFHGKIEVESVVGKGTIFKVTLLKHKPA